MNNFADPPVRTPFPDPTKQYPSWPWIQWFNAITQRFNSTPPTITGSRGGNAALTSLLTALDQQGIVVDKTTP